MNNNIRFETSIHRDELADMMAKNYTREELLNLIFYVLETQGNEAQAAKEIAANLELFATG